MDLKTAERLASELMGSLAPFCVRLEVAGSVRRGKLEPKDIELVAIPETGTFKIRNLFEEIEQVLAVNRLEDALSQYLSVNEWPWMMDEVVKRDGPNYKRLKHKVLGVACDLFIVTDRRKWAYTFAVRTGPGEFSKAIVTQALRLGMFFDGCLLHKHPPMYGANRKRLPCPLGDECGQIIECVEEADIFRALHMAYIEPGLR